MKFEKKDAHKELVARMTAKGEKLNLSDRSINEQLDALMPLIADEEMELTDFVEKVLPLFNTANANVRHDVSTGIDEYKKSNPKSQTTTTTTTTKSEEKSDVEKRLEELEARLLKAEQEKKTTNVRNQVVAKLKEKGIKDAEWINEFLSEVTIDENFDVEAKADLYLGLYNKIRAVEDPSQTPPPPSKGKDANYIAKAVEAAAAFAKSQRLEE